jgi:hypothetical protein
MDEGRVAHLRPRGYGAPIVVRVLRKWLPPYRDTEFSYLFVDEHVSKHPANHIYIKHRPQKVF